MAVKQARGADLENLIFNVFLKDRNFSLTHKILLGNLSEKIVLNEGNYSIVDVKQMGSHSKTDIFVLIEEIDLNYQFEIKISVKKKVADYAESWMAYQTVIKYFSPNIWQTYVDRACDHFNKEFHAPFDPEDKIPEGFCVFFSYNKRTITSKTTWAIPIVQSDIQVKVFSGSAKYLGIQIANCIFSKKFDELKNVNLTSKVIFENLQSITSYVRNLPESEKPHLILRTANFTTSITNYSKNRYVYRRPMDSHFQVVYQGVRGNKSGWENLAKNK